eukprot:585760-Lingulodinium_polyedra.AAC.1
MASPTRPTSSRPARRRPSSPRRSSLRLLAPASSSISLGTSLNSSCTFPSQAAPPVSACPKVPKPLPSPRRV